MTYMGDCLSCSATGWVRSRVCPSCGGTGKREFCSNCQQPTPCEGRVAGTGRCLRSGPGDTRSGDDILDVDPLPLVGETPKPWPKPETDILADVLDDL